MTERSASDATTPPLAWVRSSAFALSCAGIGTAGHAIAADAPMNWAVFAAATTLLLAFARACSATRLPTALLVLAVVVGQVLVHWTCGLASPGGAPDHVHHMSHAAGHAAHGDALEVPVAMLLVHVLASVIAIAVLLRLELRAWAQVATIVTGIVRAVVAAAVAALRIPAAVVPQLDVDVIPARRYRRWAIARAGRRGPPARLRLT